MEQQVTPKSMMKKKIVLHENIKINSYLESTSEIYRGNWCKIFDMMELRIFVPIQ